jgi:hypothetical protein
VRESVGLTMADVEKLTRDLARTRCQPRFRVTKSRLSGIEDEGRVPSIFALHALAVTYKADTRDLLRLYGIPI